MRGVCVAPDSRYVQLAYGNPRRMIGLRSFRFQLLTAVNAAIALLLGAFLAVDYRTEIARGIAETRGVTPDCSAAQQTPPRRCQEQLHEVRSPRAKPGYSSSIGASEFT